MKYKGKSIKGWSKYFCGSGYMLGPGKGRTVKVLNEDGLYLFHRRTLESAVEEIFALLKADRWPLSNPRDRATILAALRFWQLQLDPRKGDEYHGCIDIATDGDHHEMLSAAEIDVLCEKVNYA